MFPARIGSDGGMTGRGGQEGGQERGGADEPAKEGETKGNYGLLCLYRFLITFMEGELWAPYNPYRRWTVGSL